MNRKELLRQAIFNALSAETITTQTLIEAVEEVLVREDKMSKPIFTISKQMTPHTNKPFVIIEINQTSDGPRARVLGFRSESYDEAFDEVRRREALADGKNEPREIPNAGQKTEPTHLDWCESHFSGLCNCFAR